jgi:hypothetical protein
MNFLLLNSVPISLPIEEEKEKRKCPKRSVKVTDSFFTVDIFRIIPHYIIIDLIDVSPSWTCLFLVRLERTSIGG